MPLLDDVAQSLMILLVRCEEAGACFDGQHVWWTLQLQA